VWQPGNSPADNPGMRLLYNNVQIGETFAVKLAPTRTLLRNKAMIGYGFAWQVPVEAYLRIDGSDEATRNADCNTKMKAVETALEFQGGTLKFQHDDNTDTIHSWLSSQTFSGIRCTSLRWDDKPGAQFKTFRSFMAQFEWETHFTTTTGFLLEFKEEISIPKALPIFVTNQAVNNVAPLSRITVDQPKFTATQSGSAIGLSAYPDLFVVAPKIFSSITPPLKRDDVRKQSPERVGNKHRGYPIAWAYEWESATILNPAANPNLWN
jgi:hypothetical protein